MRASPLVSLVLRCCCGGLVTAVRDVCVRACGTDRRTLHCLTAPGADTNSTAGQGAGAIWTVRVNYAGTGLP